MEKNVKNAMSDSVTRQMQAMNWGKSSQVGMEEILPTTPDEGWMSDSDVPLEGFPHV